MLAGRRFVCIRPKHDAPLDASALKLGLQSQGTKHVFVRAPE